MTELSHTEIQDLLGAYALDAVEGDEREAVELHLRTCPKCRAEVLDHREVAALIAHGGAPAPDGVWDKIVAAIEPAPPPMRLELRTPPPAAAPAVVVPITSRRSAFASADRRVLGIAAAVLVVIALMGGLIVHLNNRVDSVRTTAASSDLDNVASAAMSAHGSRTTQLKAASGSVKLPAAVTKDGEGFLLASSAPALDAGHTYQLWGIVNGTAISLGTFPGGAKVVPFRVDTRVKTLAVTEEQSGGVIASHNSPVFAADI